MILVVEDNPDDAELTLLALRTNDGKIPVEVASRWTVVSPPRDPRGRGEQSAGNLAEGRLRYGFAVMQSL